MTVIAEEMIRKVNVIIKNVANFFLIGVKKSLFKKRVKLV